MSRGFKFSFVALLTLVSTFAFQNVNAADGCFVSSILYTAHTSKSGAYFYTTTGATLATCGVTSSTSGPCYLYDGSGNENSGSNYVTYSNSYSASIAVIACPIDDYIWLLFLSATGFSIFRFRKILFAYR